MAAPGEDHRRVAEILAEAAADEARFDDARPLPEVWDELAEAWQAPEADEMQPVAAQEGEAQPVEAAQPVRRRLRGKTAPPVEWQEAEPYRSQGPVEAAAPKPAARKRPARGVWPNERCPGLSLDVPCIFAQKQDVLGRPARLNSGQARCVWCNEEELTAAAAAPQRRKFLTRALRIWTTDGRQDIADVAAARLPVEARQQIEIALQRPSRAQAAVAERKAQAAEEQAWSKLLEKRSVVTGPVSTAAEAAYRRHVAEDKRRVAAKFPEVLAADADPEAEAWRSTLATKYRAWCTDGSWTMCSQCARLQHRPLLEMDITGKKGPSHTIKGCAHCRAEIGYPTMSLEMIPEVLRDLPEEVLWALRPLEPDVGRPVFARHGYRVHTDMIRFWWRPILVKDQLDMLEDAGHRAQAKEAYAYLMRCSESAYGRFVGMQQRFLRRHREQLTGDPRDRALQLPRRALEEVGLECAVWPHLYPCTQMCETFIRQADVRRQARRRKAPIAEEANQSSQEEDAAETGPSDQEEEDADLQEEEGHLSAEDEDEDPAPLNFAKEGRNSAKAAYLAKVLGPVIGYGSTYELFQFVYDLWLWSSLGAKRNTVQAPLRLAMSGYSFSPEYWHTRHAALVDVVKQLGLPTLFVTVAPYEWSFPFHSWVEDEARKLCRSRLRLPVSETLHIAHVLAQTVVGLLTGANKTTTHRRQRRWTSHVFAAKDGSGRQTVLNFFGRLEYQDGKRRRYVNQQEVASQYYHGRGTVHLHLLVWLQHIESISLEKSVAATVPEDNVPLAELVEGSQRSWTGSGWPVQEGKSFWDAEAQVLRLQHKAGDYCRYTAAGQAEGVRAYIVDLQAGLHCHLDVQASDGRGMLLKYVSGYVPKFSDSFASDWLQDSCSDYAVAKRVLTDYHPLEPEMTLQLAMQWHPQCLAGSTMQRFQVPVPWIGECPARVQQYMDSTWRAPDMPLIEFLRKTNKQGKIHQYLAKQYRQGQSPDGEDEHLEETLEAWANNAPTGGQVAVASIYLSRYNDRYYGQWVLMNVPFKSMEDLKRPELDLVPDHLYYQTLAFLHRPEHWTNEAAIRQELELEAFREHHVRNIVAMLFANQSLIKQYLDGTLDKNQEVPAGAEEGASIAAGGVDPELSRQQKQIYEEIVDNVQKGMQQKLQQEAAWEALAAADEAMEDAEAHPHWGPSQANPFPAPAALRPALAVLGPAGSGKSTAVSQAIRMAAEHGARVLVAAPTGRLAATLREKFPGLGVDTVHGAFLVYKPAHETAEVLLPYDLVVVEEAVSKLPV